VPRLAAQLQKLHPGIRFEAGSSFHWSPSSQTVIYKASELIQPEGQWALIHETGHARLQHQDYQTDYELVLMEVAAWQEARILARELGVNIDEEHIQDCLDTYRDWQHQRATCPRCANVSLQQSPREYHCHNCNNRWQVSASRFCRPYRKVLTSL
jgi:sulfur relay (sulfurtransferase) DsrC/TusE family protein